MTEVVRGAVQQQKVPELLRVITEDVVVTMPANPVLFIRDKMNAMLGPNEAESEADAGACFVHIYVECGVMGQRSRKHFSRRAPAKGFTAGLMQGWRREASEVLAEVVGSALGDGRKGLAAGNRVREVEEEEEARVELEKVATELRTRLAHAEADLQGAEAANGGWETTEELRGKLRKVFDKMNLNQDSMVDEEEKAAAIGMLNELHVEFSLRAEVVLQGATTPEEFESRFLREWEATRKEQALAGMNVARAVAEKLPGGSPETPLEHLKGMSAAELGRFCRRSVAAGVEALLSAQQETLRTVGRQGDRGDGAEESNAKYAQGEEVLGQARTALKP